MEHRIPRYDAYSGRALDADDGKNEAGIQRTLLDSAGEGGLKAHRENGEDSSSRQGPTGMTSPSMGGPVVAEEEGSMTAAEAAKLRSFRSLRTAKACDICKIRKVKCDGGEPCASCRLHNSICFYSKTTRKKLLSLSETNARNGQSVIPKNPRGRPMTTDIGNWAIMDRNSDGSLNEAAEPDPNLLDIDTTITKRRRKSSELPERDTETSLSGPDLDLREQLRPLNADLAFGNRYHPQGQRINKEGGPHALLNSRSPPRMDAEKADVALQFSGGIDLTNMLGSRRPPSTGLQMFPHDYAMAQSTGSTPTASNRLQDTPSSTRVVSATAMSAAATQAGSGSGSAQPSRGGPLNDFSLDTESRNMYDSEIDTMRRNGYQGHESQQYTQSAADRKPAAYSASTYDNPESSEYAPGSRLRSQRTPQKIVGAEADALGNAGITTFRPGSASNGLLWWGPTSFLSLQDRLAQVLEAQSASGSEVNPDTIPTFNRTSDMNGSLRFQSPEKGYNVWRWGCDKLIFRFKPPIDETAMPIDPLFLPSQLAHRFFHAYTVIVHPLYPVVSLDQVRGSISDAYAGGVGHRPDDAEHPSEHTRSMHKARDLIVLALGAQIEGGDGDAHCPKEVARAWSKKLADQAHEIVTNVQENGSVDAIRIWLLYTVFLGNYGQVDEQYVAIGHAARLVTSLGLHREPTCQLRQSEDEGLRTLFWTTYIMEKTISLWQGRPSCFNLQQEIDTGLPQAGDVQRNALRSTVDLVDFIEGVQQIYLNRNRDVSKASAFHKVNQVFLGLEDLRRSVPAELRKFETVDPASPGTLLALDTPEGEMALFKFRMCLFYHNFRMLASLPVLSFVVWQDIAKERVSEEDQQVLKDLVDGCVSSAVTTILAFHVYMARIPYLPFMGDFTTMLLYAIPIIYLDSLRYDPKSIARRNVEALRLAVGVLDHFDHPAGVVCKAMLRDFFDNYVHRPEWSAPSIQLHTSAMNNPSGSAELLSWLTSPQEHGRQRPNVP